MSKENKPEVNKQEQTQTLSEILQVRRDKLKYFQDEGRNFAIYSREVCELHT